MSSYNRETGYHKHNFIKVLKIINSINILYTPDGRRVVVFGPNRFWKCSKYVIYWLVWFRQYNGRHLDTELNIETWYCLYFIPIYHHFLWKILSIGLYHWYEIDRQTHIQTALHFYISMITTTFVWNCGRTNKFC